MKKLKKIAVIIFALFNIYSIGVVLMFAGPHYWAGMTDNEVLHPLQKLKMTGTARPQLIWMLDEWNPYAIITSKLLLNEIKKYEDRYDNRPESILIEYYKSLPYFSSGKADYREVEAFLDKALAQQNTTSPYYNIFYFEMIGALVNLTVYSSANMDISTKEKKRIAASIINRNVSKFFDYYASLSIEQRANDLSVVDESDARRSIADEVRSLELYSKSTRRAFRSNNISEEEYIRRKEIIFNKCKQIEKYPSKFINKTQEACNTAISNLEL